MRSSRGLRITSLIVVSPVLLILVSLLIILAIAIQTQIKAWYNTILVSLPQLQQPTTSSDAPAAFLSLSRFASTAFVVSQNANSSPWTAPGLSSAFDHVNNKPSFDVKTTVASKRAWSPLRRIFPTTLTAWLGFLTVIAVVTWRKFYLQKSSNLHVVLRRYIRCVSGTALHGVLFCSEKAYSMLRASANDGSWESAYNDSSSVTEMNHQNGSTKRNTGHSSRRKKARHQPNANVKALQKARSGPLLQHTKPEPRPNPRGSTTASEYISDDDELVSAKATEWVNVGEKKKKNRSATKCYEPHVSVPTEEKVSLKTSTMDQADCQQSSYASNSEFSTNSTEVDTLHDEETDMSTDGDDECDSTIAVKTPVMSDSESVRGHSKGDSLQDLVVENSGDKGEKQSWYSPFSTGLDLDILPRSKNIGSDPLSHRHFEPPMTLGLNTNEDMAARADASARFGYPSLSTYPSPHFHPSPLIHDLLASRVSHNNLISLRDVCGQSYSMVDPFHAPSPPVTAANHHQRLYGTPTMNRHHTSDTKRGNQIAPFSPIGGEA